MTRDLKYYQGRRKKYEAAIPKLRKMINQCTININRWITTAVLYRYISVSQEQVDREVRKHDALLKQYGRVQGIIQMLDAYKPFTPVTYTVTWKFNP